MPEITVQEFINLFTESSLQLIEIYDIDTEKTVFRGDACDCPCELQDYVVQSLDPTTGPRITINIGGEEA